jgi:oxygen-dependent protoporphyrinogen oxidase
MAPVDRRTVLKGLGALGATAVLHRSAWAANVPTAVVIGSGIAGLSAAYDLQRAGYRVTVLEKAGIAGGRMIETWMGPLYGNPHAGGVFGANREMFALAADVGITDQLFGDELYDYGLIDNGHGVYQHALRFHLSEILNVPGMSAETRRRLPSLMPDLAEMRAEVDPCLLATGAAYDDESMWEYYERKLGKDAARELVDYWVDPVFDAWGFQPENTSRVPILSWFSQQDARLMIPRGGIGVLTRKLATLLNVELNTTVMRVTPPNAAGRHTVHYLTREGHHESMTPDVVVCAVEGKYVPHLVQGLSGWRKAFFERIFFTKYTNVTYVLKKEHAPPAPAGGRYTPAHPDPLKQKLMFWYARPADPDDHDRPPTLSVSLARREWPVWAASGQSLPSYCLPLLKEFYPVSEDMIEDVVVIGGDDLVYLPTGSIRAMADFLRDQEKSRLGLYFAGEYLGHAHTGGACASGRSVARSILEHWS